MKLSDINNSVGCDWDRMKEDYFAKNLYNSETHINSDNSFMINNYISYEEDNINLDFDERALYFLNPPSVKIEEIISDKRYEEKKENQTENIKPFNCIKNQNVNVENESKNIFSPIIDISSNSKNVNPRKYFRVDDAKKHFKVEISKFATKQLNNLIQGSELPKRLKKKIHLPNFKLFTSNPKELDNYQFLSFDLYQVFTLGSNEENLQGDNLRNISNIFKNEKSGRIKKFLSQKYKDIIQMFYKSERFIEFKKCEKTIFFNEGIKKEKNISLLEEDGLIKLFQMTRKKRKREIFFSSLQK